ncbi:RluA family pseudouridine synthase [Paenibacillus sp. HJGM_3]|uniref:RluA family pseudouridine synthase n=1 Tax=Paenibacillus sp. HJGM_3 TaxID=3379816 RepID=UPI00385F44E0
MTAYERKGEWLEIRLPSDVPESFNVSDCAAQYLRLTPKEIARLSHAAGLEGKGGRLRARLFPEELPAFEPEWTELDILYEDDFCLVVSKPAGMAVHPGVPGERGTLAGAMAAYYESTGQPVAVRHIHRLDADTTGPVLYAKNAYAHVRLDEAMRRGTIGRTYVAVVSGRVARDRGTIAEPIGKDRHHAARRRVSPGGDPAVTHYEAVERFNAATLVRVRLETGRTHQIRVHFSHLGHPLLGDSLYGGPKGPIGRQALHGASLRFSHPFSQELIETECPLPEDFRALLENLK